jgi:hypothetical protein
MHKSLKLLFTEYMYKYTVEVVKFTTELPIPKRAWFLDNCL